MTEQRRIENALHSVLVAYSAAGPRNVHKKRQVAAALQEVAQALLDSTPRIARATLDVRASADRKSWEKVPWVALFDRRVSTTPEHGACVAFVFRADMTGVYLTLNQGVAEPGKNLDPDLASAALRRRAGTLRDDFRELARHGFHGDDQIDLRAGDDRVRDYNASTIYYKLFTAESLLFDADTLPDIEALLAAYERYVADPIPLVASEPVAWIFQINPAVDDLRLPLRRLGTVTWLVEEHADKIQPGDTVYFWGPEDGGGLLGSGGVVGEPAEMDMTPDEKALALAAGPLQGKRLKGKRPRVRIGNVKLLTSPITRADLESNPMLSKLSILERPTGTNFRILGEEARALRALIEQAEERQKRVDPVAELIRAIERRGFFFAPWQVATYVTALRTKPFVILAGVSGTGKSRLPALVSELTGGKKKLLPVRPDWTDSSDVLGYLDLKGTFRPGALLEFARTAADAPEQHHVCIVDEMNLARVEQYFAEILSHIEDRASVAGSGFSSGPLLTLSLRGKDRDWMDQRLPGNLAIVGTVNMDESAHGFSRKVLDRAFTLEISDIDLERWQVNEAIETGQGTGQSPPCPGIPWLPRAIRLGDFNPTAAERKIIERVITVLTRLNGFLVRAQLQVGYRTRDEICLFTIHAEEHRSSFVTRKTGRAASMPVDPLDIALQMKILPRIAGGNSAVSDLLLELLGWACGEGPYRIEDDAEPLMAAWKKAGRPASIADAGYPRKDGPPESARHYYPRTAARLALMWDRLQVDGYTSFWS